MKKPVNNKMICVLLLLCGICVAQDAPKPATVYVYRANQFTAKLKSPTVFCNETPLAKMQNGRFFIVGLAPGKYAFRSEDKGVGIQLSAEAGKEYFVRVEMAMGQWKGTQQVTEVSADQAQKEIAGLKSIDENKIIDRDRVSRQLPANQASR